jgi:hypothetical protein
LRPAQKPGRWLVYNLKTALPDDDPVIRQLSAGEKSCLHNRRFRLN